MGWGHAPGMRRAAITPQWPAAATPGRPGMVGTPPPAGRRPVRPRQTRAEVAGELGVSAQTTSRWYARWRGGGYGGDAHRPPRQAGTAGTRRAGQAPPG